MEDRQIEVSVVMPCLNEEASVGICVKKALDAMESHGYSGEVVVCDNGSVDDSVAVAEAAGARVVHESVAGYGAALMGGITAARGQYIIMGDADDTYDFGEVPGFVERMRAGADLVMGSRFAGRILPGAMPWSHQYIGNPVLTGILNLFFRSGVSDAHCGMRGFTKAAYERMKVQTTGMEFASEMVIKATQARLRIEEVPITYYPRAGESKLSSLRDGWRHLRFMLMYSPTWLFFIPGATLFLLGLVLILLAQTFAAALSGSLLTLLGFQAVTLGLYARTYVQVEHFEEHDPVMELLWRYFNLEKGILLGIVMAVLGIIGFLLSVGNWTTSLVEAGAARGPVLGMTLTIAGVQTVFSSFFLSMMGIPRKH